MGYDVLLQDGKPVIIEMSYGYYDTVPWKSAGYYQRRFRWRWSWSPDTPGRNSFGSSGHCTAPNRRAYVQNRPLDRRIGPRRRPEAAFSARRRLAPTAMDAVRGLVRPGRRVGRSRWKRRASRWPLFRAPLKPWRLWRLGRVVEQRQPNVLLSWAPHVAVYARWTRGVGPVPPDRKRPRRFYGGQQFGRQDKPPVVVPPGARNGRSGGEQFAVGPARAGAERRESAAADRHPEHCVRQGRAERATRWRPPASRPSAPSNR